MANNSISLTTLDFDTIKSNLKSYLRSQDIFKDYDFDGSNMSVLLDILSYNTSMQAYYVNMLLSEAYMDSAQLRSSVLSHSKDLNYLPKSYRSASATVRLRVEQSNSDTLVIPKGTSFTSTFNLQSYTFTTDKVLSYHSELDSTTNTYVFETDDIEIYEGVYVTENFVMNYSQESQKFVMSNENVDTSSVIVNVIENSGSTTLNYSQSETLLGLTNQSRVYFLQCTENKYEIIFGDNILGRRPADGATISVQYRVSSGSTPNGATKFTCDLDLTSDSSGRVTTVTSSVASGGSEAESIDSIKYNAPRHFQTQLRAVTSTDYETLLKSNFSEISAISAYGGETVSPPQYGKIFIALSILDSDGIPDSKKSEYASFLKTKMPSIITPVFVEPTYVYAKIVTSVKYNINVTTLKDSEIRLLVTNAIAEFNDANLNDFNSTLYYSSLVKAIDSSHESIISNITDTYIYKKINPKIGYVQNFDIDYGMSLRDDIPSIEKTHGSRELRTVFSTSFTYNGDVCVIEDDGNGTLRLMKTSSDSLSYVKDIGTVDYSSGTLQITNFTCTQYTGQSIRLYALPSSRDITSSFGDILRIENSETVVNIRPIRTNE